MDSTAEMKRKPRPAPKKGRRPDIGSDLDGLERFEPVVCCVSGG